MIPGTSEHWRAHGRKPVWVWGTVLWLMPNDYDALTRLGEVQDATDEQIERQDAYITEVHAENTKDMALIRKIANKIWKVD